MEWQVGDHTATSVSGENREMLRVGQFAPNHNIGSIAFNPTAMPGSTDYGMLYVTLGDGGSAHDPANHGQNAGSILGTILRINPLGGVEGESEYGIPADNPFADGVDGLGEIFLYGVRHPQHLSWDTSNGQMYFTDIGQDQIEEVNQGVAGGNYGWRLREGTFATAFGVETTDSPTSVYERPSGADSFVYPVAQYDHDEGFAIGGGFVYRGTAISELAGKYVFSELVRGRLLYVDVASLEAGNPAEVAELRVNVGESEDSLLDTSGYPNFNAGHRPHNVRVDLLLSRDLDGELYVLTMGDGWVRKLVAK